MGEKEETRSNELKHEDISNTEKPEIELAEGDDHGNEVTEVNDEPINLEYFDVFDTKNLSKPFNPKKYKAEAAKWVAKSIVSIFGATLGIIFLFYLVLALIVTFTDSSTGTVGSLKEYVEAFIQLIEATSDFASAVFAPLLAFILGYYFGTKEDKE